MEFIHFDDQGNALMVDVGDRAGTKWEVATRGGIFMSPQCLERVAQRAIAKGDVLGVAGVAGIMGAKRTSEPIPLCHVLNLTELTVDFIIKKGSNGIEAVCTVRTAGKIGVEIEAPIGVSVALLTVYDTYKAVDKSMKVGDIYLGHKNGGKSGEFHNPRCARNRG